MLTKQSHNGLLVVNFVHILFSHCSSHRLSFDSRILFLAQIKKNLFWGVLWGIMKRLPWIPSLNSHRQQGKKWHMQHFTFLEFLFFSSANKQIDPCVENAKEQASKNSSFTCGLHPRGCLLSCSTEVGWMIFSASFGLCCFPQKRWPILSGMEDQRRLAHWSHEACIL